MASITKASTPVRIQVRGKAVVSKKANRSLAMLDAVRNLQEKGELCDFEVRAGAEILSVHRFVLQMSSDYFRTMLQTDMIEARQGYVEMKDLDEKAVMSCVRYLYTGEIELELDSIHDLLNAANLMQLEEVKSICFEYCISEMTVENCIDILALSKQFPSEGASKGVVNFISCNLSEVADTAAFTEMEKEDLDSVILCRSTSWYVTGLWIAVSRWISHDETSRSRYTLGFLTLINEFDVECLFDLLVTSRHVLCSEECTALVAHSVFQAAREKESFCKDCLNMGNCFLLKRWIDRYSFTFDTKDFKEVLFSYMEEIIVQLSNSPHFVGFAVDDVLRLLKSERGRRLTTEIRWAIIGRWSSGQRRPITGYATLFEQVDLSVLSISYIQSEVLRDRDVQSSNTCKDIIIEALCNRAKRNATRGPNTLHRSASVRRQRK